MVGPKACCPVSPVARSHQGVGWTGETGETGHRSARSLIGKPKGGRAACLPDWKLLAPFQIGQRKEGREGSAYSATQTLGCAIVNSPVSSLGRHHHHGTSHRPSMSLAAPPSSSPAEPPQRLAGLRAGFCAMRKLTCRRDVATTTTGLEQGVSHQQCPMQPEAQLQVQTLCAPRIDTGEDGLSLSQPMTTLGAATAARFPSRQCRSEFTLSTT